MKLKFLLVFLVLFTFLGDVLAQELNHVQGQILILLENGKSPETLFNKYKRFEGKNTNIKIKQVISEPLNIWEVSIDYKKINEKKIKASLENQPEIKAAQKNFITHYRETPNDPFFNQQWQYINNGGSGGVADVDTDIEQAWDITTGGVTAQGDTIVVCVIDNGGDDKHQDLIDNFWINKEEIPDNGVDDDQNGYVDDVFGWDAVEEDGNVFREGGHGTSVIGIVGAKGNNGLGVSGVNWDVKVMQVRGGTNATNAIKSYTYPYLQRKLYNETNGSRGAYVVATNASWGFEDKKEEDAPIFCAFYDELGKIGILNVTATTNRNIDVDIKGDLPSNCTSPYLITVTNLTRSGQKLEGAGYGNISIDLAAPGDKIYTTGKPDRYREFQGTSGSAPLVAGAIGLLYSVPCPEINSFAKQNPSQAAMQVKDLILGTVDQNPNMKDLSVTEGNLNIGNAVTVANNFCNNCTFPRSISATQTDGSILLSWINPISTLFADIRYRELGGDWQFRDNLINSTAISNLQSCTVYEVQFRSDCLVKGPYSQSYYFETDGCCRSPQQIEFENINNSMRIEWEEITAATQYTVEYSPIGEDNWESITVSEPEFILYGITSCQAYDFRLRSRCGFETTEFTLPSRNIINCSTCQSDSYCGDAFMDNDLEWIKSVQVGDFQNESNQDLAGYGNYIGLSGNIVTQGESVEISVDIDYSSGAFQENLVAYFDWNQNGIFEEEEKSFAPTSATDVVTENIDIPIDALPGATRMRVIMAFESINSPCKDNTIEYGEIEDYCIIVQSASECTENVSIDNFSTAMNSIEVLWTDVVDAENYIVEYRLEGAQEFTSTNSQSPSLLLEGLDECSTYEVRVKSICNVGESTYSEIRKIRTRCTTSIIDPDNILESYRINPNPFQDQIEIKLNGNLGTSPTQFFLYDLNGRVLKSVNKSIRNNSITLKNLSEIPAGVYIITVTHDRLSFTERLIKL